MNKPKRNVAAARTILVCSCEGTMRLDGEALSAGCPKARLVTADHLCGGELHRFREAAAAGAVTVACTAQRPLFEEVAEDEGLGARFDFANIRETAGWSADGAASGPKMAALLAIAEVAVPPPAAVSYDSEGVALIYGPGGVALEVAEALKDRLDITVLLSDDGAVTPPLVNDYPIRRGKIRQVTGYLGAFEIAIDRLAAPRPSSRGHLAFGPERNGATSKADLLIDLCGGTRLVAAGDLRAGYLRADPADREAVLRLLARAGEMTGTFDKPRFVELAADLCAHSRSRKTGCTRCLTLCPAGAISPAGDAVAIDPHLCGGCGQCAAACPTGAAAYAVPTVDVLLHQIRAGARAYLAAGGRDPVLLLHDHAHGDALIAALARHGAGLPARVVPLAVNEATQVGIETILAAVAYGFRAVRVLTRARPRHDIAGLIQTAGLAEAILPALGYGSDAFGLIGTDDPDALAAALTAPLLALEPRTKAAASFAPLGSKRELMKLALKELHAAAATPRDAVALPAGAPFGGLTIDAAGCTLCLSCVSACPTSALGDGADRPLLSFDESLCVQCGLCVATCPEKVIALAPRIDFTAFDAGRRTVKEEEPFCCVTCGKPFGVKSTIERITAKLAERHWMYSGDDGRARLDLIRSCDDCRVTKMTNAGFDPYASVPRSPVRTTDDYLREREAALKARSGEVDKGEA